MLQVLVVDDEKNVLTTLSIGLRRYEYVVKQARSGLEALQIMEEDPCDFVVSDIRMSPMDGYTLASHIHEKYPSVSIVLMSAYGFEDNRFNRVEGLIYHRLTKPFTVSELVQILMEEERKRKDGKNFIEEKRNVLVLGHGEEREKICNILETAGFLVEILESEEDCEKQMQNDFWDLFLIDEGYLDSQRWKILNELDQHAPQKPVILLVKNSGKKESLEVPDLAVTVVDRDTFFQNQSWVMELLKKV